MKKFFFFAVLASTVLASCSKITPEIAVVDNNDNELPITFQAVNYVSQTKAGENVAFPTTETFGAYAWFNASANPDFMNNQEISYQTDTWKAKGQTYYWPKSGKLDFVAYAPYAASPWVAVAKDSLKATTLTIGSTDDYLYSDKAKGMTYSTASSGVAMTFHHALAKICVKAKAARLANTAGDVKWEIKVSSAKIDSVAKTGSVKLTLNATDSIKWDLPASNVWTASEFAGEYAGTAIDTLKTEAKDLIATTSVLPQELTHGTKKAALHISYSITTKMNSGSQITETFDREIPLTTIASSIASWGINKSIVYTIVIDPLAEGGGNHEITFVPTITDWDSETPADHTISK